MTLTRVMLWVLTTISLSLCAIGALGIIVGTILLDTEMFLHGGLILLFGTLVGVVLRTTGR